LLGDCLYQARVFTRFCMQTLVSAMALEDGVSRSFLFSTGWKGPGHVAVRGKAAGAEIHMVLGTDNYSGNDTIPAAPSSVLARRAGFRSWCCGCLAEDTKRPEVTATVQVQPTTWRQNVESGRGETDWSPSVPGHSGKQTSRRCRGARHLTALSHRVKTTNVSLSDQITNPRSRVYNLFPRPRWSIRSRVCPVPRRKRTPASSGPAETRRGSDKKSCKDILPRELGCMATDLRAAAQLNFLTKGSH